jgi:pimeloyl-ACP methyl ester carboxylesterase
MRPSMGIAAVALVLTACAGSDDTAGSTIATAVSGADPTPVASRKSPTSLDIPDPPGELVDVNGHQMHLYCTGEGEPTVLLETGLGDASINFRPLQDELATSTRVCAHDRAGYGWSEPGPEPRDGEQIAGELRALLATADEPGPYVLAGHSMGGLIALIFAEANPDDVAGVVLIDSSHPRQVEAFAEIPGMTAMEEADNAHLKALADRAEAGEIEAADLLSLAPGPLPVQLKYQWAALAAQPQHLKTTLAEADAWAATISRAGAAGSLGDIPLTVLVAGIGLSEATPDYELQDLDLTREDLDQADEIWRDLQEDHVGRSTNSKLVVAENSTHYIYFDEPEVVIGAIRELTAGE